LLTNVLNLTMVNIMYDSHFKKTFCPVFKESMLGLNWKETWNSMQLGILAWKLLQWSSLHHKIFPHYQICPQDVNIPYKLLIDLPLNIHEKIRVNDMENNTVRSFTIDTFYLFLLWLGPCRNKVIGYLWAIPKGTSNLVRLTNIMQDPTELIEI